MGLKFAVLTCGLWLGVAPGFAVPACCSGMPSPKSGCGTCGDPSESDTSSRPDCCAPQTDKKDIDAAFPRNEIPRSVVSVEFLVAFMPLLILFLSTIQMALLVIAKHAASPKCRLVRLNQRAASGFREMD